MEQVKIPVYINLVLPQHLARYFYDKAKQNYRGSTNSQILAELQEIFDREVANETR